MQEDRGRIHAHVRYTDGQSTTDVADNRGEARRAMMRWLAARFVDPAVVKLDVEVRDD